MNKQFKIQTREDAARLFERMADFCENGGKPLRVDVKLWKATRTLPQNNTVHKWFGEIAEFTGDSPASVKEDLKQAFLPQVPSHLTGKTRPKGTSELSTMEMSDFMEQVQMVAANLGCPLTQPEEA